MATKLLRGTGEKVIFYFIVDFSRYLA